MEYRYSEDYIPTAHGGKQTLMKIIGDSIYVTFERLLITNNIRVQHIPKPTYMSLAENKMYKSEANYKGEGHFSIIQNIQCHPNSYMDILNNVFHIPDFFTGGNVLTLSDKIITIWEEGLEVHTTSRLKYEDVSHIGGIGSCSIRPIRFFLARKNISSIEGTGRIEYTTEYRYQIYINEFTISVEHGHVTNTAMTFTNEEEYDKTLTFLIDNIFSGT